MRRLIVSLFSILFFSSHVAADAIDDINQQVIKPEFLNASFTQKKYLKILKTPLTSNGKFWISKSEGIVWRVEKPLYAQVVLSKNGVMFSDQQSQQTAKSMEYVGKLLQGLLGGDLKVINEQFDITVIHPHSLQTDWELELQPKSLLLRKGILSITLSGNTVINHIILHEATGDKTDIEFLAAAAIDHLPEEIANALNHI